MPYGLPWSEEFARELSDKEFRDVFVQDQARTRIALLVRALREARNLSQAQFGELMGKPQSVVSRMEDPDYGKLSLQSLFDAAAALDLPLWVDFPEWDNWLRAIRDVPGDLTARPPFDEADLVAKSQAARDQVKSGAICEVVSFNKGVSSRSPKPAMAVA